MRYETVLWYADNWVIDNYAKRYFESLLERFEEIPLTASLKNGFKNMSLEDQTNFLMYPDISSLIHYYEEEHSQSIIEWLDKELDYLLSWDNQNSIIHLGTPLPWISIKLTDIDYNPHNDLKTHPDQILSEGSIVGWGERDESEWRSVFEKTFDILKQVDMDYYHELNTLIKKIVPMKTSYGVHTSCSYKECIWTLYLWYTIDAPYPELNNLEALIHESNHNKLNLIMQTEQLHTNDFTLQYYSPYRPDARHIQGVILGVHALVSAVYVMLSAIQKGIIDDVAWQSKVLLFHIKNKLWMKVIQKHARLTPIWEKLVDDMTAVLNLCDQKIRDSWIMHTVDTKRVQEMARSHFQEVIRQNPYLKY